jgi:hypothetical protein
MTPQELDAAKVMLRATRAPITLNGATIVAFTDADPFGIASRRPASVPTAYFADGTTRPEADLLI